MLIFVFVWVAELGKRQAALGFHCFSLNFGKSEYGKEKEKVGEARTLNPIVIYIKRRESEKDIKKKIP